jgi:hypothetical protein
MDRIKGTPSQLSEPFFFIELHVELTNEEKAIIEQYNLGALVLDECIDPSAVNSMIEEYNATPPFDNKKRESLQYKIKLFNDPLKLTISHFIADKGLVRNFSSLRQTTDYAQHLKTHILPQIKHLIEYYSSTSGKTTDTFEL